MVTVADYMADIAAERAERERRAKAKPTTDAKTKFYSSVPWRRLRYEVLAESAARNGGVARCELCGDTAAPGRPLNIDHIEPLSKRWDRRLDRANLQVLCGPCNHGKLGGPARDFRPAVPAADG